MSVAPPRTLPFTRILDPSALHSACSVARRGPVPMHEGDAGGVVHHRGAQPQHAHELTLTAPSMPLGYKSTAPRCRCGVLRRGLREHIASVSELPPLSPMSPTAEAIASSSDAAVVVTAALSTRVG